MKVVKVCILEKCEKRKSTQDQCCFYCEDKDECENACKNTPQKCKCMWEHVTGVKQMQLKNQGRGIEARRMAGC